MALRQHESVNNQEGIMSSLNNIGRVYFRQLRFEDAKTYISKSLKIAKASNNQFWMSLTSVFLGEVYQEQGELEQAQQLYEQSIRIAEAIQNNYTYIYAQSQLAQIFMEQGELERAANILSSALVRARITGKRKDLEDLYNQLATIKIKQGKFYEAQVYLDTALHLGLAQQNQKYLIETYQIISDLKQQQGDYQGALQYYKESINIKDNVFKASNLNYVPRFEAEYAKEKQENQLNELSQINQKQEGVLFLLCVFILIVLLVGSLFLWFYYQKNKLNQELEVRVATRTLQLQKSNNELQRFAYIASHDLKTPLRTISSFLTLIKRKIKKYDDNELEDLLSFASNGAKQMNTLIEEVLEYSQLPQTPDQREAVNLNEILHSILHNLESLIQEKKAKISCAPLPVVHSQPGQMHQLFQNLIVNGIKYNDAQIPEIQVQYQQIEGFYEFCITDNGIGIEPIYQESIFEMFKRLHNKEQYEGTGIGLALCKKIVERHRGRIWIESELGKGSKFYFTLAQK